MKINKNSSALILPKQRQRVSAFTLIELLVVIAIIAVLASIALPAFTAVQERGKQTKDMSNGKQIALALKQFATDHDGSFPQKVPGTDYATAGPLVAGSKSNDAFWWLFPTYLTSEDIFVVAGSAWCPNGADNNLGTDQTGGTRVETLKNGECGYLYITNLNDTSNPQYPVVADGGVAAGDPTYTNVQTDKGGIWKGKKTILIFVDGSGKVMTNDDQTAPTASFVKRPANTYNILDAHGTAAGTDPWIDSTATVPNLHLPPG
jgi:prepilin-type N-terminal cleavage/methylation domain-containing protein